MLFSKTNKLLISIFLIISHLSFLPAAYAAEEAPEVMIASVSENDSIEISSVTCTEESVTINGTTAEAWGSGVSMMVTDSETGSLISVDQVSTNTKHGFLLEFSYQDYTSLDVSIAGEKTGTVTAKLIINSGTDSVLDELEKELKKCKVLLSDCAQAGIETPYENMYYNLIMRSAEVMRNELGLATDSAIIENNLKYAYEYCDIITDNLNAYLKEEKAPLTVPTVLPGDISYSGKSFFGTVIEGGGEKTQPVFLNGYNMGWERRDESDNFISFGQNVVTESLEFDDVVGTVGSVLGWGYNPGTNGYADADITISKDAAYGGTSSLKLVNRSTSSEDKKSYLWQIINVKPNTKYHFSGRYMGTDMNVRVKFDWGKWYQDISGTSTHWKEFYTTYTTSASESGEVVIMLQLIGETGEAYFDDIEVWEDGSSVNLLKNGDFEDTFAACENSEVGICTSTVQAFKEKLDSYNEKGIAVILNPSLYELYKKLSNYPEAIEDGKSYSSHLPYNITHPRVMELTRLYFKTVLPIIKDCENLVAIQLTNEPTFTTADKEYYKADWAEWLENKYQTEAELSSIYGIEYTDFADVPMTDTIADTPHYNDWREFNASVMTEYNAELSKMVEEYAPELWVMTKIMMYTAGFARTDFFNTGTNYEDMAAAFDINGNDAAAYLGGKNTIESKNMWYDLQTSILERPVFNLENHVISDKADIDYSKDYAGWVRTNLWQGMLHGLGGNLTWLWGISDQQADGAFRNTTMQYRLDCMIENAKVGYDANRLAAEVAAIANKKPDVAVLYSYTSPVYYRNHEVKMAEAYKALVCRGLKPVFVTEQDLSNLDKCDMLIVPYATNVPAETLKKILSAAKSGKTVVMLGSGCLGYDENNQAQDSATLSALKNRAVVCGDADIADTIDDLCEDYGLCEVDVTENSAKAENVEISSAVVDGRLIINLCNYETEGSKTVKLSYNGTDVGTCRDLISNTQYSGSTVTLEALKPVMLEVDLPEAEFTFSEADGELTALAAYRNDAYPAKNTRTYVAVYSSENKLIGVMYEQGKSTDRLVSASIDAGLLDEGGYAKAFLWDEDSGIPLLGSKVYERSSY
ncbi:MAG: beta-galactosidase [Clostridia bacterium]|nr:beta-galactosidase [Clostridia bacterium]MBP3360084.1 beta-galactosidase [Clostridia bacterium]